MNAPNEIPAWQRAPDPSILTQDKRPAPPFPKHLFGRWQGVVSQIAEATGAPSDYVGLGLLCVASVLVSGSREVRIKQGWTEPPIIWGMCLGDPSVNKSPPFRFLTRALSLVEADLNDGHAGKVAKWEASDVLARASEKKWREQVDKAIDKEEEPPKKPVAAQSKPPPHKIRLAIDDTTVEKLASIAAAQPDRAIMVRRDELSGLLGGMGRYSGAGAADQSFYSEGFNAGQHQIERKSQETVSIDALRLIIFGNLQPELLSKQLLNNPNDGLAARFAVVWPDAPELSREDVNISPATLKAPFARLAALKPIPRDGGGRVPASVPIAHDAHDAFYNGRDRAVGLTRASEGMLSSFGGKMPGLIARVALVMALLDWAFGKDDEEPLEVTGPYIEAATAYCLDYLWPMAERAYGDASQPEQVRAAASLLRWLAKKRKATFQVRDVIQQRTKKGLKTAKQVRDALAHLEELGWVESDTVPSTNGGKMREIWRLHPSALPQCR